MPESLRELHCCVLYPDRVVADQLKPRVDAKTVVKMKWSGQLGIWGNGVLYEGKGSNYIFFPGSGERVVCGYGTKDQSCLMWDKNRQRLELMTDKSGLGMIGAVYEEGVLSEWMLMLDLPGMSDGGKVQLVGRRDPERKEVTYQGEVSSLVYESDGEGWGGVTEMWAEIARADGKSGWKGILMGDDVGPVMRVKSDGGYLVAEVYDRGGHKGGEVSVLPRIGDCVSGLMDQLMEQPEINLEMVWYMIVANQVVVGGDWGASSGMVSS